MFFPVRHVAKQTNPQRAATLEQMQQTDPLSAIRVRAKSNETKPITKQMSVSKLQLTLQIENSTSSLRISKKRTEDHRKKFPQIPELVWQQHPDRSMELSNLVNNHIDTFLEFTETNHTP